jgi:Tol biopolymer transport system component
VIAPMPTRSLCRVAACGVASGAVMLTAWPSEPAIAESGEGLRSDIYAVDLSGRNLHRLTPATEGTSYESPSWSPDGRKIAFSGTACEDNCPPQISILDRASRRIRSLHSCVSSAERPSFAPDGRRLVFIGGDWNEVYTVAADGSGLKRLTDDGAAHDQAVWSPDGSKIAYTRQQPNGRWDIYLMNADGSGKTALTRTSVSEEQPAWSPDGKKLAFVRQARGHWSIYVMRVGTTNARKISRGNADEQNPACSPDGKRIAFVRTHGARILIYVSRLDGRGAKQLRTRSAASYNPAWAPDGKTIAFVRRSRS